MKTILFVMPRLPFPASSGRKTSLYHYCKILSEELGYRLVVASFLEEGDKPENKPNFIHKLVILPKPKTMEKVKNILIRSLCKKELPMQVSLYLSNKAQLIVDQLIKEEKPDILIADMVRSTEYIRGKQGFTIADLDDRISLRYRRQMETDIEGINPYGAFLSSVPSLLKKLMLIKPIKLKVVKREIELLTKYELTVGEECSSTVFVAEKEAVEFNKELGREKAYAIPIGVDVDYFSFRECGNSENTIGFLGALGVAHNEYAVKYFINCIFPKVIKKVPDAKFLVIGGGASKELLDLSSENVIFTGRVDDVRTYLEKCKVFVCPMTFGSGIKTKNLEAMSMGLPVVTTTIGAENINAQDGIQWLISDNKMDQAICSLLLNDGKRRTIGKKASEFIRTSFTWSVARDKFKELLND